MTQLILASTSAIRRGLLQAAGIEFTTTSPRIDEADLQRQYSTHPPAELAAALAEAKALSLSSPQSDAVVIGADQVLSLEDRIIHKPGDRQAARAQLRDLRNKTHYLTSAITCARHGKTTWSHSAEARLTVRDFSDAFLDWYLDAGGNQLLTSVGAYQLEGLGIQLFDRIEGDYFTILGLPLLPLLAHLRDIGSIAT